MADMVAEGGSSTELIRILYFSRSRIAARPDVLAQEIWNILTVARTYNRSTNVTGVLFYGGTHFAQVLEGARPTVLMLMDRIRRNPRHDEVTIVHEASIAERDFLGWAMAYVDGTSQDVMSLSPLRAFADIRAGRNGAACLDLMKYLVTSDDAPPQASWARDPEGRSR